MNAGSRPDGLVDLGRTGWRVWESAVLRGPGFPADGLDRLADPGCAQAADAYLSGATGPAQFTAAFDASTRALTGQLHAIATDPLFREAVTWQSLNAVEALDGLARSGPAATRNYRQREREIVVTRYWQRYCAKNDTIGFFGPVCWARFEPGGPAVRATPGPALVRAREVDLEWRALTAYADRLAADSRFRPWLPVSLQPHLAVDGDLLLRVGEPPEPLSPAAAVLLSACDGTRTAARAVSAALAEPRSGLRTEADAYLALNRLAEAGLVRWGFDLPLTILAEERLVHGLSGIGDEDLRSEALSGWRRLVTARDGLAAAAGDPDAVRAAMVRLKEEFVAVTGGEAWHRPGATYAGRGLAYEETLRDLEVVLGEPVLELMTATLVPLLHAARWLTAAMARAFTAAMRELYADAAEEDDQVRLGDLWHLGLGIIFGPGPVGDVLDDFLRRWSGLLGVDVLADGVREVTLTAGEVARGVADLFPAEAPGWAAARLHSPDLHLCASSLEAMAGGDFTAVLGELHIAWLTNNSGTLTRFHPDPGALRAALHRDLGDRVVPLYPSDFPEFTARMAFTLDGPGDTRLAYEPAPAADRGQVLPLACLTVSDEGGELVARSPDGRSWPVLELFGAFLSARSVNAFKVATGGAHTPRVSIDRLVVQRETWRTTVGECPVAEPGATESDRYLAVRRWRARLGLPERVFIKVGTEIKPCYVDFTSPAYVAAFTAMIRTAYRSGGAGASLSISELLPAPEQAWVPGGGNQRFLSELRMTVRDPVPARTATRRDPADG